MKTGNITQTSQNNEITKNPTNYINLEDNPCQFKEENFKEKLIESCPDVNPVLKEKKLGENSMDSLISKKFSSVIKNSFFLFLKAYAGRIVYSILQLFTKKRQKLDGIKLYLQGIFNMGNLRTSLMISVMPFLFDVFKRIIIKLLKYYGFEISNDVIVFLSGFFSSYFAILIEEKSKLLNYIVLAIAVRVVHSFFIVKYKDNHRFKGKFWDFIYFLIAAILMIFTNFLNPSFQPITALFDSYANFINTAERDQMYKMREIYRIV